MVAGQLQCAKEKTDGEHVPSHQDGSNLCILHRMASPLNALSKIGDSMVRVPTALLLKRGNPFVHVSRYTVSTLGLRIIGLTCKPIFLPIHERWRICEPGVVTSG